MRRRAQVQVESAPARSLNSGLRSAARTILWPVRRFFDPRFVGIHDAIQDLKRIVIADMDARNEAVVLTGRMLEHVEVIRRRLAFDPEAPHSLAELDETLARILNYGVSHEGFAAQASVWFNPPILVGYDSREVSIRWVNERIVEVPYAFRALSRVPAGSAILDVGASESTVCLSLATLGYEVTAIDTRPNPLVHDRLRVVVGRIEDWASDTAFDAVLCLSTIEHIGFAEYGQEHTGRRLDLEAMARMRDVTKAGGLLVLTTSVGPTPSGQPHRVYDQEALDELLCGWEVEDVTLVQRRGATSWATTDETIADLDPSAEMVAMVTATKSSA
jgi:SAM-dependent methyltransferase